MTLEFFVTGSQVYGQPNPKSDLDLVVKMQNIDEGRILENALKRAGATLTGSTSGTSSYVVQIPVNVMLIWNREEFLSMWSAREACRAQAPVGKMDAKKIHRELCKEDKP